MGAKQIAVVFSIAQYLSVQCIWRYSVITLSFSQICYLQTAKTTTPISRARARLYFLTSPCKLGGVKQGKWKHAICREPFLFR